MTPKEYTNWTNKTVKYPNVALKDSLTYCTLGLTGEAGEVAEKIKKWLRDTPATTATIDDVAVLKELGDVVYYVTRLAWHLGSDLQEVIDMNVGKLEDRVARGKIGGSGDTR